MDDNHQTIRDVPVELRRQPPAPVLAWVEEAVGRGARVVRVRRRRNAWASAIHEIRVEHGGESRSLILRRWVRTDLPRNEGVEAVHNEARVLELLESASVTTPRLLAFDADAHDTDAPALLMTRLPGRDVLAPANLDAYLDGLVTSLRGVHEAGDPGDALGAYYGYNLGVVTEPPTGTSAPDEWERAIEIANLPVPDAPAGLCHRDYWPGNVLWSRGRVSGVVDWTAACRGSAAADVAHCRQNLAVLFGADAADEFARRYGPVDALAWFEISVAVGMGDRQERAWRWHDAGRTDITDERLDRALDAFVVDAVRRYGEGS